MTDSPFKSFADAAGGSLLKKLERRVQQIQSLTEQVRGLLSGPERDHVIAAAYHQDTLVITTDSAAWTAQIRFAQDDLRRGLVAQGNATFVHLKVRVGQEG